jgi:hypothetical protein
VPLSRPLTLISRQLPTVRVDREIDLRRFPSLPRATQKSEQMYKGQASVERVNARLKVFWGVAVHTALATLLASAPHGH